MKLEARKKTSRVSTFRLWQFVVRVVDAIEAISNPKAMLMVAIYEAKKMTQGLWLAREQCILWRSKSVLVSVVSCSDCHPKALKIKEKEEIDQWGGQAINFNKIQANKNVDEREKSSKKRKKW